MTGFIDPLALVPAGDDDPVTPEDAPDTAPELDQVRQLVLRAHPDVVPELVAGATIAELLASIGPAEAAYANLAARLGAAAPTTPQVPAGTIAPSPLDLDRMPVAEKLRRGLAERNRHIH